MLELFLGWIFGVSQLLFSPNQLIPNQCVDPYPRAESYLHYIRRTNPIPAPGSANAANATTIRETVKQAYELALKEAGCDVMSGGIWREYIAFLGEKQVCLYNIKPSPLNYSCEAGRSELTSEWGLIVLDRQYLGTTDPDRRHSQGVSESGDHPAV